MMAFPRPKFKTFLGEACPQTSPGLGRLRRVNFSSPACTFKISRYADYQYLVAHEINAQGWKTERLGPEGNNLLQEYLNQRDKTFASYTVTLKPQKTPAHLLHIKGLEDQENGCETT